MTYVVTQGCVDIKDKSCIRECPVDCIYEGSRMMYINPTECIDCGACEIACPTDAIYFEDDVPVEFEEFTQANAEFFAEFGAPGGADRAGKADRDAALIAALPAREGGA